MVIQISDEQYEHLTNEKNQLTTQLWDTRRMHSLIQMELSSQLNENRNILKENTQLRTDQLQQFPIPQSNPQLVYKHIINSNLLPSKSLATIDIQLHDQLIEDLKGDHFFFFFKSN